MATERSHFFENNLALLKKHHPHIWQIYAGPSPPAPAGETFLAENGRISLRATSPQGENICIHDKANPEAEAVQFLEMVPEEATGSVVYLGMGLGYGPLALCRHRPNIRHLAVFELDPAIFAQALQVMDLAPLLQDPRLILSVGDAPDIAAYLTPASRAFQLENVHTLRHMPSFHYRPGAYEKLNESVYAFINAANLEGATVSIKGRLFMENRFKHLTAMHHNQLLESLQNIFTGIPAIIVAGGPSLDLNIHHLPKALGKAVFISADSSVPALLAQGISPHFISSIDFSDHIYEKIANTSPLIKNSSLVCLPWASPNVTKKFPARTVYWAFTAKPVEKWINHLLGGSLETGGAGTVAHLNLIAAIVMGCSPIIFIGQDLAYTSSEAHNRHAFLSDNIGMKNTLENKKDFMWVDGLDGSRLPSTRSFVNFKKTFEEMMAANPGQYINSTARGAHLEGTEVIPLDTAISRFCTKKTAIDDILDRRLNRTDLRISKRIVNEFKAVTDQINELQKLISSTDNLTRDIKKELVKAEKRGVAFTSFATLPPKLQKWIHTVDTNHKKIDGFQHIWQILQEVTTEGARQSDRMRHASKQLEGKPEKYAQWLRQNLEMLLLISRTRRKELPTLKAGLSAIITHHSRERRLLGKTEKSDSKAKDLLELARFYFDSDDLVLAQPVLERIVSTDANNAEACFLLGCIDAHQTKYDETDHLFAQARRLDHAYDERVAAFRREMGDKYLAYAEHFAKQDRNTAKRVLFKGLRYCGDHPDIKEKLQALAGEDLEAMAEALHNDNLSQELPVLESWHRDLREHAGLASALQGSQVAELYRLEGDRMFLKGEIDPAIESYEKALSFSANRPDIHISLMEAYFRKQAFPAGLDHLNKAVSLDRNYAALWETIGDDLQATGQPGEAISAYENCFTSLPENIGILKKIGDCYLAAGEEYAAREAYRLLKEKLTTADGPPVA